MPSIDDIISNASPVERTVDVCVAGDLYSEYDRIQNELVDLEQQTLTSTRLSGSASQARGKELQEKLEELSEQMREKTYTFTFRAVSAKRWSDLLAEHPDPKGQGLFNVDTFPGALISASCVSPEGMDDPEKVSALLDVLSPAQQAELFDAAWGVHNSAPKGLTASTAFGDRHSSETS